MRLVKEYGRMWPRNGESFKELGSRGKVSGVYVLYDGSMPVYVGKGLLVDRLSKARTSKSRGRFWDYFSWYVIPDKELRAEAETLLLKTLPYYLRLLNSQTAAFIRAEKAKRPRGKVPEAVNKPRFIHRKKGSI